MPETNGNKIVTLEILKTVYDKLSSVFSGHVNEKDNPHEVDPDQIGAVPVTRKINGLSLDEDIALPVDSEMSDESENPVQNKVVKAHVAQAIAGVTGITECTIADKGKFLRVNDEGVAEWQEIGSAENEYF